MPKIYVMLLLTVYKQEVKKMELYQMIVTTVSTVGFPIAVALIMIWYLNEERVTHANEMEKLRRTLEENSQALIKLRDFLEMSGGKK